MKIPCPCHGCTQRHFCCHASCSKYAAYRTELNDMKEHERRLEDFNSFLFATKKPLMRKNLQRRYYKNRKG